eukprot:TRINITY_DN396_c1_g1_i3.p5 TRINITY_DN396_c1_g1~~TRINITY_DN396_c1_g1_i3.p5  ORF type:complete len:113 (-),score=1.91 TRINITY_DN396_c1_g1_i3:493-831(-)
MSSLMSMQGYMRNLAVWMMCFNDLLPNIMLLVKAKSKMQTSLLLQQTVLLMRIQRIRDLKQTMDGRRQQMKHLLGVQTNVVFIRKQVPHSLIIIKQQSTRQATHTSVKMDKI